MGANAACPHIISYSTAAKWLDAPVSLAPVKGRSLLDDLARITDPRKPRGRRHALGAVAAVLFCARSLVAIGEWAADALQPVLAALGCVATRCVESGGHKVRRPCAASGPRRPRRAGPGHRAVAGRPAATTSRAWRQAVVVDGKTLRGSGHHGQQQVHLLALLAVMDHTNCAVLAQTDVDAKTNEIARLWTQRADRGA